MKLKILLLLFASQIFSDPTSEINSKESKKHSKRHIRKLGTKEEIEKKWLDKHDARIKTQEIDSVIKERMAKILALELCFYRYLPLFQLEHMQDLLNNLHASETSPNELSVIEKEYLRDLLDNIRSYVKKNISIPEKSGSTANPQQDISDVSVSRLTTTYHNYFKDKVYSKNFVSLNPTMLQLFESYIYIHTLSEMYIKNLESFKRNIRQYAKQESPIQKYLDTEDKINEVKYLIDTVLGDITFVIQYTSYIITGTEDKLRDYMLQLLAKRQFTVSKTPPASAKIQSAICDRLALFATEYVKSFPSIELDQKICLQWQLDPKSVLSKVGHIMNKPGFPVIIYALIASQTYEEI